MKHDALFRVLLLLTVWLSTVHVVMAETKEQQHQADALFFKAVAATREKKYDTAIDLLNQSIKLSQTNANAYANLASIYAKRKSDFPRAEKMIKRAIAIEPNDFTYYWDYALILTCQGQHNDALRVLNTASRLAKAPSDQKRIAEKAKQIRLHMEESVQQKP
jgi:tetratricopeptide (TPR) repeat protein